MEKKPRAAKSDGKFKGASFMQPLRKGDVTRSHLLVGAEAFAAVEESQVAAEDAFFYKFYTAKAAKVGVQSCRFLGSVSVPVNVSENFVFFPRPTQLCALTRSVCLLLDLVDVLWVWTFKMLFKE